MRSTIAWLRRLLGILTDTRHFFTYVCFWRSAFCPIIFGQGSDKKRFCFAWCEFSAFEVSLLPVFGFSVILWRHFFTFTHFCPISTPINVFCPLSHDVYLLSAAWLICLQILTLATFLRVHQASQSMFVSSRSGQSLRSGHYAHIFFSYRRAFSQGTHVYHH